MAREVLAAAGRAERRRLGRGGVSSAAGTAGQPVVQPGAEPIQAHDLHLHAVAVVLLPDRIQRGDRGGIPDLRLSEINSDMTGRIGVIKAINQVIA